MNVLWGRQTTRNWDNNIFVWTHLLKYIYSFLLVTKKISMSVCVWVKTSVYFLQGSHWCISPAGFDRLFLLYFVWLEWLPPKIVFLLFGISVAWRRQEERTRMTLKNKNIASFLVSFLFASGVRWTFSFFILLFLMRDKKGTRRDGDNCSHWIYLLLLPQLYLSRGKILFFCAGTQCNILFFCRLLRCVHCVWTTWATDTLLLCQYWPGKSWQDKAINSFDTCPVCTGFSCLTSSQRIIHFEGKGTIQDRDRVTRRNLKNIPTCRYLCIYFIMWHPPRKKGTARLP